jgi:hypothetical protein
MRRIDLIALVAAMALLALGPLALTLTRTDRYHSTAFVSLNPDNPAGRYLPNVRLLSEPLTLKDVQKGIAHDVDWFNTPKDLPDLVKVSKFDARSFAVTARGPGGTQAQSLAAESTARTREAAETAAILIQGAQLTQAKRELRRSGLSPARRARLQARRAAMAASLGDHRSVYTTADVTATLPPEKIGDRVLGALPGERTFRPNPVWAGVAGFALAGALGLWAFALGGVRPRRRASTAG